MKELWRNPFHVVLKVENQNCAIVKKFRSLGLNHLKVVDVGGSIKNSVKHLIELDPDDLKQIKKPSVELKKLLSSSKSGTKRTQGTYKEEDGRKDPGRGNQRDCEKGGAKGTKGNCEEENSGKGEGKEKARIKVRTCPLWRDPPPS